MAGGVDFNVVQDIDRRSLETFMRMDEEEVYTEGRVGRRESGEEERSKELGGVIIATEERHEWKRRRSHSERKLKHLKIHITSVAVPLARTGVDEGMTYFSKEWLILGQIGVLGTYIGKAQTHDSQHPHFTW